jgi:signal transduction histidine kinase
VNLEALPEAFAAAMEQGSLLPAPLGNGELGNEILSLKVIIPVGRVVFARGGGSYPVDPDLEAAVPFADTYRAVLDGWEVRAAVDPAYARELIIGGLPRTRLPLLLGLMALAAGLVAVALRQVRREKELARLRSEFVSRVSHELRTPLTQIRMFAETLLLKRVRSVAEEEKALRVIDRESRRLSHLVENILQFSRGERGDLRLSPRPRLLEPFVEELVEEVRPLADRVNLALDLEPGLEASVDGDALRQVLLNLLDNALKYGPAGQTVTVGLGAAGPRRLRLWVEDQGPGVPESQRERIWERFHRLERDRRSAVAGTGIGLAVVRDLVRQHGGEVWVEAAHRWGREARGARFIVELPRIVGESEVPAAHPVEAAP